MIFGVNSADLVYWLLFGVAVAAIIHFLDPTEVRGGLIATLISGAAGALAGGLLANLLLGFPLQGFSLETVLVVLAGSILAVVLQRAAFRDSTKVKITRID